MSQLILNPFLAAATGGGGGGGGTTELVPTSNKGGAASAATSYLQARSTVFNANVFNANNVGYEAADYGGKSGIQYAFYQAFLEFNTSALVGTITAATLRVRATADAAGVDFTLQARLFDFGTAVASADWRPGADIAALPLLATRNTSGMSSVPATYDLTENGSNLRTNINRSGMTRIILVTDQQISASDPGSISSYQQYDLGACRLSVTTT